MVLLGRWSLVFCTALVLALGLAPTTPSQSGDDLVLPDPTGDVEMRPAGASNTPLPPADGDHLDITRVTFGRETPTTFDVGIQTAGWDPEASPRHQSTAINGVVCSVRWTYESEETFAYSIEFRAVADPDEPLPDGLRWQSLLRKHQSPTAAGGVETRSGHTVHYDADRSILTATVQKGFVPYFPLARVPGLGDVLVPLEASCRTDAALAVTYVDEVDTEGHQYAFRHETSHGIVRMAFTPGAAVNTSQEWHFPYGNGLGQTPIAADHQSPVPLYLKNMDEMKRLIALEVEIIGGDAGWNVTVAPTVTLRAYEERSVNLIVRPPPGAILGDSVDVVVRGQVAASEGTPMAARTIVVAPVLGDDHDTFFFHARTFMMSQVDAARGGRADIRWSLLEEEPGYDDEPFDPSGYLITTATDPVIHPVRLDADEPATLTLEVVGDPGSSLWFWSYFSTGEDMLYQINGDFAPGTHTVSLHPYFRDSLELAAGTHFFMDGWIDQGNQFPPATLDPKGTSLRLPVTSLGTGLNLTDGRFVPNLALAPDEDRVTYLNPGKRYTYDLVLANDGFETDDLRLAVTIDNVTWWRSEIIPGPRFRLEPGEATPVAVQVMAPASAAEGEVGVIQIRVTSQKDVDVSAGLTLRAIVTTGMEIDEKLYEAREDQIAPFEEVEDAPGLFIGIVVVLLALAGMQRRKR